MRGMEWAGHGFHLPDASSMKHGSGNEAGGEEWESEGHTDTHALPCMHTHVRMPVHLHAYLARSSGERRVAFLMS